MKWNQLSGKAAQEKPWVNYLIASEKPVHGTRGANRQSRRAKNKDVRLELKRLRQQLPNLEYGTQEHKDADLRKSELEMWQSGSSKAINAPYVKGRDES